MIKAQLFVRCPLLVRQPDATLPIQYPIYYFYSFRLQPFQLADALHTSRCQQRMDIRRHLPIVVNPRNIRISWRIDSFISDDRNPHVGSHFAYRLMQRRSKRMGSIHHQPYRMLTDKLPHSLTIHRPVRAHTVMQRQLLLARLCAVIIAITSFFQHLCRPATFRRPAEYQYHAAKVRKSEKKNKGNIFF